MVILVLNNYYGTLCKAIRILTAGHGLIGFVHQLHVFIVKMAVKAL